MIPDTPAAAPSPWLVIIDPKLRGLQGHYIPLALGCLKEARRRGFKTILACNVEAPTFLEGEADSVQRVFAPPQIGSIPRLKGLLQRWTQARGVRAIRIPRDAASVTVILPTFFPDIAGGLCWSLRRWPRVRGLIALSHENPPPARVRLDYRLLSASRVPVVHGVFHRSFCKAMSQAAGVRYIGLPHPFEWDDFNAIPETVGRRDTILFAGALRVEKGAAEIVTIIRDILPDAERLGLRILCYAAFEQDPLQARACLPIREELERLQQRSSALALRTVAASNAEMEDDYRRAAVTVLAYNPEAYQSKTSGILMEATISGSPVVVSRGTHMERMIQEGHAAGVAVDYHDREAWRRGILKVVESAPDYQAVARSCSQWWRRFWNAGRFLRHGLKAIDAAAAMRAR